MKKWKIILPTLFATSGLPLVSLVSCGDKPQPVVTIEFKQDGEGQMSDYKTATISIDWTPSEDSMEISEPSFTASGVTVTNIVCTSELDARPREFQITFESDITDDITEGVFGFHYEDKTLALSGDCSINDIKINKYIPPGVPVTGVTINEGESRNIFKGKSYQLSCSIEPADATNKNVTWSTEDDKVAKIDQNGKITAVGNGTTTITVTTEDGGHTDTFQVTVFSQKPEVDSWIDQHPASGRFESDWVDWEANTEHSFGFECSKLDSSTTSHYFSTNLIETHPTRAMFLVDDNELVEGKDYWCEAGYRTYYYFTDSGINQIFNSAYLTIMLTFSVDVHMFGRLCYS